MNKTFQLIPIHSIKIRQSIINCTVSEFFNKLCTKRTNIYTGYEVRNFSTSRIYNDQVKYNRTNPHRNMSSSAKTSSNHSPAKAYLSLGANLGDRYANIQLALRKLKQHGIKITNSSYLYESSPLYITEQPLFLNCAVEIETSLSPSQLLDLIKTIESSLGRRLQGAIRNSARPIDLDILFYNNEIIEVTEPAALTIPHISIDERGFVLKPLCDINPKLKHPKLGVDVATLYHRWLQSIKSINTQTPVASSKPSTLENFTVTTDNSDEQLYRVFPLIHRVIAYNRRTFIMGIVNITPDSFSSDGLLSGPRLESGTSNSLESGLNFINPTTRAIESATNHWRSGADIIDIGGESTRPGAAPVDIKTELERILPIVTALHKAEPKLAISVDTYHSETAKLAIQAGAHIVNDISGGLYDENMLKTVAELECPYILMHTRGTPETMQQSQNLVYKSLISDIKTHLEERINLAIKHGIYRWNLIADPGIGFAKTAEQNLEIIRNFNNIRPFHSMPMLVGPSRKGFIGKILESKDPTRIETTEMNDRNNGTAAVITSCVSQGIEFVRVHDVNTMRSVCRVADAIYR